MRGSSLPCLIYPRGYEGTLPGTTTQDVMKLLDALSIIQRLALPIKQPLQLIPKFVCRNARLHIFYEFFST